MLLTSTSCGTNANGPSRRDQSEKEERRTQRRRERSEKGDASHGGRGSVASRGSVAWRSTPHSSFNSSFNDEGNINHGSLTLMT